MQPKRLLVVYICSVVAAFIGCGGTQDSSPASDLAGTWNFVPSQEQTEFAGDMGKTAGPLKYTFNRDNSYSAKGGPLSGKDYREEGVFEFDGQTLLLHRKSVNGERSPVYERSSKNTIRFENDGNIIVGGSDFGDWLFTGPEVRFRRI